MNEILSIVWDWLHWIIFGVGCVTLAIVFYGLFIASYDKPKTDEEIMREKSKGEGM